MWDHNITVSLYSKNLYKTWDNTFIESNQFHDLSNKPMDKVINQMMTVDKVLLENLEIEKVYILALHHAYLKNGMIYIIIIFIIQRISSKANIYRLLAQMTLLLALEKIYLNMVITE